MKIVHANPNILFWITQHCHCEQESCVKGKHNVMYTVIMCTDPRAMNTHRLLCISHFHLLTQVWTRLSQFTGLLIRAEHPRYSIRKSSVTHSRASPQLSCCIHLTIEKKFFIRKFTFEFHSKNKSDNYPKSPSQKLHLAAWLCGNDPGCAQLIAVLRSRIQTW